MDLPFCGIDGRGLNLNFSLEGRDPVSVQWQAITDAGWPRERSSGSVEKDLGLCQVCHFSGSGPESLLLTPLDSLAAHLFR